MIKLSEGGFAELWTGERSPEVLAISYAVQMAVSRIIDRAERTKCYSMIDALPEDILDYLAVEMRAMYYDQELPIDKKRTVIKNALNWYKKSGTAAAVKELLEVIFGSGELQEWFEYGGKPFHFRVDIEIPEEGISVGQQNTLLDSIEYYKNVRSHLDSVNYHTDITGVARVGACMGVSEWLEIWPELINKAEITAKVETCGTITTSQRVEIFA